MAQSFGPGGVNNAIFSLGAGQIGPKQSIYEIDTLQKAALGTPLRFDDGRVFRYGYFKTTTARSLLTAPTLSTGGLIQTDNIFTAAAIDAVKVVGSAAGFSGVAANDYAGGYLCFTAGTGSGFYYRIKSNTAQAANEVTFTLYDALLVAIDTTTDGGIFPPMYNNLIGATFATNTVVSGVTMLASTALNYAWVQTWGPGLVLCDGTPGKGVPLQLTSGAITGAATVITMVSTASLISVGGPIIGYAMDVGQNTEYLPVFLTICP